MKTVRFAKRRAARGMVLLELLVALTIFAVVSLGLVMALHGSFGAAQDRNAADEATRGLRNQLALLHGGTLISGERDADEDGSGIAYHVSVAPEPMLDQKKQPVLGVLRTTVTAKWKRDGRAETRTISELVYQP
jgi:prepilin-type N-terminal cleavage/methylation domain-containing protein